MQVYLAPWSSELISLTITPITRGGTIEFRMRTCRGVESLIKFPFLSQTAFNVTLISSSNTNCTMQSKVAAPFSQAYFGAVAFRKNSEHKKQPCMFSSKKAHQFKIHSTLLQYIGCVQSHHMHAVIYRQCAIVSYTIHFP